MDTEIVPHSGVQWPKAVEANYGMEEGSLRIKARAGLVGYILRSWGIDSTDNHCLDPASHQLWLRNP